MDQVGDIGAGAAGGQVGVAAQRHHRARAGHRARVQSLGGQVGERVAVERDPGERPGVANAAPWVGIGDPHQRLDVVHPVAGHRGGPQLCGGGHPAVDDEHPVVGPGRRRHPRAGQQLLGDDLVARDVHADRGRLLGADAEGQQVTGDRRVGGLVARAGHHHVVAAVGARPLGAPEVDLPARQPGQFQRHVLGDVPEVGSAGHGVTEPAGPPGGAVVAGQPGQHGEQAAGEARVRRSLLAGQFVELEPGDDDRSGQVAVRAAEAAQVDEAHVCPLGRGFGWTVSTGCARGRSTAPAR
jgi:hypothetical protein